MSDTQKLIIKDLNCANCTRKDCDLSNEHLEYNKKSNILDVGRIMIMRCTTEMHGCASHPLALQVTTAPVIEELNKIKNDVSPVYNEGRISINISDVINLLKRGE